MNSRRVVRTGMLCSALLCFSATIVWASCDKKDRPKTPTNLKASMGRAPGSALLIWRFEQTRTGLTYYDIFVRGPGDKNLGVDVTRGAAQHSEVGQTGQFSFDNLPPSPEYNFAMRARTPGGCVSEETSEWVKISPFAPTSK